MDELKERIERMSEERRKVLQRLAPDEYERLFSSPPAEPVNDVEARLLRIWTEVLAVPVTRRSNYFELGGDSILSVLIAAKARASGLQVTPTLLFANPTVHQLAAALMHEKEDRPLHPPRAPSARATARLTPIQQGMVFHSLHDAGKAVYMSQLSCVLPASLDLVRLEREWSALTERHLVLRSSLDMTDPLNPLLRAHHDVRPIINHVRLSGGTAQEVERAFERFLQEDLAREFDLQSPPLMRLTLLDCATGGTRCVWTHHHMILDGWSEQILLRELQSLCAGHELAPLTTSFFDYADWLNRQDTGSGERFWRSYLSHGTRTAWPVLPQDTHEHGGSPERVSLRTSFEGAELIRAAQSMCVTPAIVLEGAWALTLGELAHAADVIFGMTATVRPAELPASDQIVGLCINTLPLRAEIPASGSLSKWLAALQGARREWLTHGHVALSSLLRLSGSEPGLFDTLFVFENLPGVSPDSSESPPSPIVMRDVRSTVRENYAVVLVVTPGVEFTIEMKYAVSALAREEALRAVELFESTVRAMVSEADLADVRRVSAAAAHNKSRTRQEQQLRADRERLRGARRTRGTSYGGGG